MQLSKLVVSKLDILYFQLEISILNDTTGVSSAI